MLGPYPRDPAEAMPHMVADNDPPDHAGIIVCVACKRDIPPKDGRFRVGGLSYHVGCYERPKYEGKGSSSGS
jgi:hypothetical protein